MFLSSVVFFFRDFAVYVLCVITSMGSWLAGSSVKLIVDGCSASLFCMLSYGTPSPGCMGSYSSMFFPSSVLRLTPVTVP